MKIMNLRAFLAGGISIALFGFSQSAMANWSLTDCDNQATPCIVHNDDTASSAAFNINDGSHGQWHGIPGTGSPATSLESDGGTPFTFSGETTLVCDDNTVICDLSLDGFVKIEDSNTAGIKVVNAEVDGGIFSLCWAVTVDGLPWYMDDNSSHGPYDNSSGISTSSPYVASIGPIGVDVSAIGVDVDDGHMHDVTYNNLDTFSFGTGGLDETIYINGSADDDSGCSVSGDLRLEPTGDTLEIYP